MTDRLAFDLFQSIHDYVELLSPRREVRLDVVLLEGTDCDVVAINV